jgi:Tol biopolymer transport system component
VRFSISAPEQTRFSAAAGFVTVSPDGTKLAFTAVDSSAKSQLWVRPLDSETAQPLPGTDGAALPFWSADSRFLGFLAEEKLKRIAAAGGPAQTLAETTETTRGTWSAEGVVLFTRDNTIHRVSAAGGTATPVTTLDASRQETDHAFPHFLPDGNHFLYLARSSNPENNAIRVGSLDGTESKLLLAGNSTPLYAPPGYLLFAQDQTLMAQPFDADALELTGEAVPVVEEVQHYQVNGRVGATVSENGVLAYRNPGAIVKTQLTWFDRGGRPLGQLGPPGPNDDPELSPDGKRLAVERQDAQSSWDTWLVELERETSTRFTFDSRADIVPLWSPDGGLVAFASNRTNRIYNLYQRRSSGAGNDELLFESGTTKIPMDWSADGRYLIYSNADPKTRRDLWVLPMFGDRKPILFLQTPFEEYHARFSPNGRWIAYISNESGTYQVYVQSFPEPSGKWMASTNGGIQPRWRRDGKELFYLALDGKLMAVPVGGTTAPEFGAPAALFEARTRRGTTVIFTARQEYDVTADGQRFLLNVDLSDEAASPISVVLNWTALLTQ